MLVCVCGCGCGLGNTIVYKSLPNGTQICLPALSSGQSPEHELLKDFVHIIKHNPKILLFFSLPFGTGSGKRHELSKQYRQGEQQPPYACLVIISGRDRLACNINDVSICTSFRKGLR
jgi:hypothetical protein